MWNKWLWCMDVGKQKGGGIVHRGWGLISTIALFLIWSNANNYSLHILCIFSHTWPKGNTTLPCETWKSVWAFVVCDSLLCFFWLLLSLLRPMLLLFRACPECRVKSDFVTPSKYWTEDSVEKQRIIDTYKHSLW